MENKTPLPVIHLNGSSAESLASDYQAALKLARELGLALRRIDMHQRNYPLPDTWVPARDAYHEILVQHEKTHSYLTEHFYHCEQARRKAP